MDFLPIGQLVAPRDTLWISAVTGDSLIVLIGTLRAAYWRFFLPVGCGKDGKIGIFLLEYSDNLVQLLECIRADKGFKYVFKAIFQQIWGTSHSGEPIPGFFHPLHKGIFPHPRCNTFSSSRFLFWTWLSGILTKIIQLYPNKRNGCLCSIDQAVSQILAASGKEEKRGFGNYQSYKSTFNLWCGDTRVTDHPQLPGAFLIHKIRAVHP